MVFRFLFLAGFIYALLLLGSHIFVLAGLAAVFKRERKINRGKRLPCRVSVIVPARNEAENLFSLFETLEKQTLDDFQIILVDDRSEDNTFEMMNTFRKKHPERVEVIRNDKTFYGKNPKQMVLDIGAKAAAGEILLFTDADCRAGERWVEYMISPFTDDKVGLVFGSVTSENGTGLLRNFQIFDHLLRYHYTASCAGLKNPTGGFGNNLAIRSKALDEIGGFSDIEFSVTEDAQLIARVRDTGRWVIEAQTTVEATVVTLPAEGWMELCRQELRWSTGAIHAPDWKARAGYGFVMYQLATGAFASFFAYYSPVLLSLLFSGILSMLVVSTAVGIHRNPGWKYWAYLFPSLLIAEFLFPSVVLKATFRPLIIWKGNKISC